MDQETSELIMPYALITILFGGLLFAEKRFPDKWSPLFLMSTVWLCVTILFVLGLVSYNEVSVQTWLLLIVSYLAFSVGCLSAYWTLGNSYLPLQSKIKNSNYFGTIPTNVKSLKYLLVFLFVLSTVANFLSIQGGFQQISVRDLTLGISSAEFRRTYTESTIGSLQLLNVIFIPFAYLLIRKDRQRGWQFLAIIGIVLSCLALMLSFSRASMLRAIFFTTMTHHFFVARLYKRQLITLGAISLVLFVTVLILRSPYYDLDHRFWVAQGIIRLPKVLSFLSTPYVYATSPIVALNEIVEVSFQSSSFGAETFGILRTILYKLGVSATSYSTIYEAYEVGPFSVNVATYLRHFYLDFQLIGCIIFPWGIGLVSTYIYQLIFKKTLHFLILPYSVIAWDIIITPFSNHFILLFTPLTIVYFLICSGIILQGKKNVSPVSVRRFTKRMYV